MSMNTKTHFLVHFSSYLVLAMIALIVSPFIGGEKLDWSIVFTDLFTNGRSVDTMIVLYQRIPRIMLGFLTGGSLALVGSVFQVILRNPLATPYTLGVTGGGTLGAVIAISLPGLYIDFGPFSTIQLFSLAGSSAIIILIYFLSKSKHGLSIYTILLAGVTLGIICSAMILFLRYLVNPFQLVYMDRWMMGGLNIIGYKELSSTFPFLLPGLFLLFTQANSLNLLTFGSEMASGYGVEVQKVQIRSLMGGCLATASVVSLSGAIGFIGLIIPHGIRRISGYDHKLVLPCSFLAGGSFLVICDVIARTVRHPAEIPVGIITALIGGPIFIKILLKKRRDEF
jgi:iron complex transport system permease protein